MPILGLTGRGARFPEIGKLFKGGKKEKKTNSQGREYETFGKELDYWRFESNEPHIVKAFNAAFADVDGKPREIPVYLPFSQTEQNFEAWQEAYTAGGLAHRCNGEECVLWFNERTGTYETAPGKPCPTLSMAPEKAKRDGCKPVARLRVVIPALNQLGFVTVETHSKNDILHLDSALHAYETLRPEGLRGIPMLLCRFQKEISTPGDGKRARRAKWLIALKPHPQWAALYLDGQHQQALASVASPLLLTTNLSEEDDEYDDETPAPASAPIVDAEREKVLGDMRRMFLDKGKTEADWQNYQETLRAKPTENLKTMRANWQATVARAQAAAATAAAPASQPTISEEPIHHPLQPELTAEPVHEAEIVEEAPAQPALSPIREELEQMVKLLQSKGCSPDHINAKIAKLAGGVYAIDEIEEEIVPKVRLMLNNYLKMTDPAAEMGKEFKKK